jgi:tetratricopeptide (TPR) repeat protein
MATPSSNLLSSLRLVTTQVQGVLEANTLLEKEKQELETRVSGLMQEIAKLKQTNATRHEHTVREITALKKENTELKQTAEKLEQTVAPLQRQVKDLTERENAVLALLQPARSRQVEQPVEQPAPEIVAIDEKIAQAPNDPKLYLRKANLLMKQKDHNGAKSCFEIVEKLTINTNFPQSSFRQLQARNLLNLNQRTEALETIQKAIKIEATDGINYYVEAEVYIAMDDKANAKISAEKAKNLGVNIDKLNLN